MLIYYADMVVFICLRLLLWLLMPARPECKRYGYHQNRQTLQEPNKISNGYYSRFYLLQSVTVGSLHQRQQDPTHYLKTIKMPFIISFDSRLNINGDSYSGGANQPFAHYRLFLFTAKIPHLFP